MKKALVLAGGGAKGSYQVGVWRALCELGWRPDIITGTSVGCLNGVMFALDAYELARDMWLSIGDENVMKLPEGKALPQLSAFVQDLVRGGGLDVTPLEAIVERVLDEEKLRAAPIRFGLVTVERRGLRAQELTLEEIPKGKLADYLMASAACFPAIRPRVIDGKTFIDGGYSDNMPFGLAQRMGADELLCVNVDGVGLTRPNLTHLPTVTVESWWDLGELFRFVPETARRNMELGYNDTFRAFGRMRGTAYAIEPKAVAPQLAPLTARFDALTARLSKAFPALKLAKKAGEALFGGTDKPLIWLESAANTAGVDPTKIYSPDTLAAAFIRAYPLEKYRRLEKLFLPGGPDAAAAALAAVSPAEYLAAAAFTALTEEPV
ncbi:MAG: patatin-like phospholipase family protein [Faecalibacterium sp.]|jgi:NTE family protein|nr:patatin-like phospholipase family protein [Faecalibacterium sp.]